MESYRISRKNSIDTLLKKSKNEKSQEELFKTVEDIENSWKTSLLKSVSLKKEKSKIDVFITDPILVDEQLFYLWLEGIPAQEASIKRFQISGFSFSIINNIGNDGNPFQDMVYKDTLDHYRNFNMLEHYLQLPELFLNQSLLIIDFSIFKELVEKYYGIIDEIFLRLAGKKLKSKNRNILDDISEKTKIPLKCCRRQFDNLKRIYDFIIEKKRDNIDDHITDLIQKHFQLSNQLSIRYSRYIFLSYHRIETTDKRLKYFDAPDFEFFASVLMEGWTEESKLLKLDLDPKFKEDIRDCKTHLSNKGILNNYKSLVIDQMKMNIKDEKKLINFSHKFHIIVKTLLNIGAGISKSAEFEDILEDLEEKVTTPCIKSELTKKEVDLFFQSLEQKFYPILSSIFPDNSHKKIRYFNNWSRYLKVIRQCVIYMWEIYEKRKI